MADTRRTSTFEKDFIERTYTSVVTDISIAFSELVANAWDAGASQVMISLPSKTKGNVIIEDNGTGMTDTEFQERWMVIAYNRVAHQGEYIDFVTKQGKSRRLAYGRNGVGRHAMLCFDDSYTVETWRDGVCNQYEISVDGGESAFSIIRHNQFDREGHGTRLAVKAKKKCPLERDVVQTLIYRFLFDPEFSITVNGKKIENQNIVSPVKTEKISLKTGEEITINIYSIPEGEKNTASNGIAFWAGKRLIGNPSWNVGKTRVEDARRKFALRHLIVVQADCLIDDVFYDWSHFRTTEKVNRVFDVVVNFTRAFRVDYYKGKVDEVKTDAIRSNIDKIEQLPIPALYDLKNFFETFLEQKPEVDLDDLNIIVAALVNVLQTRNGLSLLSKLSQMDGLEIDSLDRILDEWSVSDITEVLNIVDIRLKIINAIEKLCNEKTTDELHVLHPLVSQAKWLFGIEYDSPHYVSNRALSTVIKTLLESQRNENLTINWNKRPDLVISESCTVGATCIEDVDENEISVINKILIIELKRGGFKIGRNEVNQAEEYIDSIYKGNRLNCKPQIKAYVIGDQIDPGISTSKTQEDYGKLYVYTYMQLVKTAEKRLFKLKEILTDHYNQLDTNDYLSEILGEPRQLELKEDSH